MTDYEIGDDEYEETEEVNTSYDQDQPIGDEPQALNTELSNSEPIDAETGEDFYTIQTGGAAKKIGEFQTVWQQLGYESLNLDGTGVARATRGVNPNKAKSKVLRFIYVSKSDCPICKQYDGHSWAVDSPNRPIIPRLEGKHGSRPFTHPHCKCKWVNVFSDEEVRSSEVNQADFDRTRKWYGAGFDDLTRIQQKMAMIDMFKQSLGMEADAEEDIIDPVPIVSMAQIAFDTIKPIIKHKLGKEQAVESEPSSYGIQSMLDDIVSKSLSKDEKKEIEESTELESDFSLNTLLGLVADRLAKKIGKKLGVESKPNEYTKDDSYRSECQICGAPLDEHPITEGNDPHEWLAEQPADWEGDMSLANEDIYDNAWDGLSDEQKEMYNTLPFEEHKEGGEPVKGQRLNKTEFLQIANAMGVKRGNEGGKGSGRAGHQKWMLAGEAGEECSNCMMITEKENGKCLICGN